MKISNLLRSLDVKIKDAAALFGRINDNFDVIKRILQSQVSLGDNIKCDIVTGQFDSGVPRACGLKNLKIARGAIVLGSEHPCIATPLTAMSGDQAAVTLFFAGLRHNVTATILLFDEGFSGTSYGSLLATSTFPGIVKPDASTITVDAAGVLTAVIPSVRAYTSVTGNYTATSTDHDLVVTTLSANLTVTLPSASSAGSGRAYTIKDGTGTAGTGYIIKIAAAGSDTVDGAPAIFIFDNYGECRLISDGTSKWYIDGGAEHVGVDPRSLTGLKAWYDCERGVTLTTGEAATAWADQSGNGFSLGDPGAAGRPTMALVSKRRMLFFSSQYMASTNATTFSTGVTVYAVVAMSDWETAAWRCAVAQRWSTTQNGWGLFKSGAAAHTVSLWATLSGGAANMPYVSSAGAALLPAYSRHLLSARIGAASPAPTAFMNGRVPNGVTAGTAGIGTTISDSIYIGQSHKNGANADYWLGGISEVVIFDAIHTDAEMALMNEYLLRKHPVG